jgi:hypothetical protein
VLTEYQPEERFTVKDGELIACVLCWAAIFVLVMLASGPELPDMMTLAE